MLEKMSQYIAAELGVNPWQVKVAIGVCTAATLYALGSYDLF